MTWSAEKPPSAEPFVLITDHDDALQPFAAAVMRFLLPSAEQPTVSYWAVSPGHPIGAYFSPIDVVAAPLNLTDGVTISGTPVIAGLVNGRKAPIVVADERDGRRSVAMLFDPSKHGESTTLLLAFFNSLRWLMGGTQPLMTGEPITLQGFHRGAVTVHRPDGALEPLASSGGAVQYDATTLAGPYRFVQGAVTATVAVNFIDPVESNVLEHPSTWFPAPSASSTASPPPRSQVALSPSILFVILALLVIEWVLYSVKGRSTVHHQPSTVIPNR